MYHRKQSTVVINLCCTLLILSTCSNGMHACLMVATCIILENACIALVGRAKSGEMLYHFHCRLPFRSLHWAMGWFEFAFVSFAAGCQI